jgi:hypothetical protein
MINDARRDQIFEQMNGYTLTLDPSAIGPRYFIDKIAICRNYLNDVSLVLSELQREKLVTSSELHKLQAIIELEGARLLSTDDHVRRLANIKDRESMVAHILVERHRQVNFLKDQLLTIDGLMKHVSLRNRELHATMDAIKNQRRFMHIEVQTGAFYGDERIPEHERGVGMGAAGTSGDFGEASIRRMIEESTSNEAVAEITAALDEAAATASGDPQSFPLPAASKLIDPDPPQEEVPPQAPTTPVPVQEVSSQQATFVPSSSPQEVSRLQPQVPTMSTEDVQAIRAFLGDPSTALTTDEPSPSVAQAEVEDFSFLLDSV